MEALSSWLKGHRLNVEGCATDEARLIYAFEACGVFYAATVKNNGDLTLYWDELVSGRCLKVEVTQETEDAASFKLAVGEVCTLLQDTGHGHDLIFTDTGQAYAEAHEARRVAAYNRGDVLILGILRKHSFLLADLLPF